jgi:hypothetical protein
MNITLMHVDIIRPDIYVAYMESDVHAKVLLKLLSFCRLDNIPLEVSELSSSLTRKGWMKISNSFCVDSMAFLWMSEIITTSL